MRTNYFVLAALGCLSAAQLSAQSPQPDISTLAQALDRCMATHAVRMTKTDAKDEAMFAAATAGCKPIETDLLAAVRRDVPQPQADTAIAQWAAQAKPNFMAVLQKIRADRAARASQ